MRYGQKEFEDYFKRIQDKKITKRIVQESADVKKIIIASLIMLVGALITLFSKGFVNIFSILAILIFFYIGYKIYFLENKGFINCSLLQQQFYLIFLMKEYIIKHFGNKRYIDYMFSIQSNYVKVVKKNIKLIQDISIFTSTKEEKFLGKICEDYNPREKGVLCDQEQIGEAIKVLDILLNIILLRIKSSELEEFKGDINSEIEGLVDSYMIAIDSVTERKNYFTLSHKMKWLKKKFGEVNKKIVWLMSAVIVIVAYVIIMYRTKGSIDSDNVFNFAISMAVLVVAIIKQ